MRNYLEYWGGYTTNTLLCKVRCHIEIRGSEHDLELAHQSLIAMGWIQDLRNVSDTSRDGAWYLKDIRGLVNSSTRSETIRRLQQRLVDSYSCARVNRIVLRRIRYPSSVIRVADDLDDGPIFQVEDRSSQAVFQSDGGRHTNRVTGAELPKSEPQRASPLRTLGRETAAMIDRTLSSWRWLRVLLLPLRIKAVPTSAIWRKLTASRGAIAICAAFVSGIVAVILGITVDWRVGEQSAMWFIWPTILMIGAFVVVGGGSALTTRIVVASLVTVRSGTSPRSPWVISAWIEKEYISAGELLGSERRMLLVRVCAVVNILLPLVFIGTLGYYVFVIVQLVRSSPALFVVPSALGAAVVWLLLVDMVRSRRRRATRGALLRVVQFASALGVGVVVLKVPAVLFYHELGATDIAWKAPPSEILFHAAPFVGAVCATGAVVLIGWLVAPRLEQVIRDLLWLVLIAQLLGVYAGGIAAPLRQADAINSGARVSVNAATKATCSLTDRGWQPTWTVGRSDVLVYDRNPENETAGVKLSPSILASDEPRVVDPSSAC